MLPVSDVLIATSWWARRAWAERGGEGDHEGARGRPGGDGDVARADVGEAGQRRLIAAAMTSCADVVDVARRCRRRPGEDRRGRERDGRRVGRRARGSEGVLRDGLTEMPPVARRVTRTLFARSSKKRVTPSMPVKAVPLSVARRARQRHVGRRGGREELIVWQRCRREPLTFVKVGSAAGRPRRACPRSRPSASRSRRRGSGADQRRRSGPARRCDSTRQSRATASSAASVDR